MGKLKHRAAAPKRASDQVDLDPAVPPFEPLPPPKRRRGLLMLAIGLVAAWIVFLSLLLVLN